MSSPVSKANPTGSRFTEQAQNHGDHMKSKILTCMMAIALFAALAVPLRLAAQANYSIVKLGALGGTQGQANSINNRGWATGIANFAGDATGEATLWFNGSKVPLGSLGGPNSGVFWPVNNTRGIIAGIAETPEMNPLQEKWSCSAFFPTVTYHICVGFVWRNGVMTALPTLGGYNGYATGANNLGQVVGWAENMVHDPTCTGRGQVLQFRAVIWGPQDGQIQELPPLPGDTTSAATAINDLGQVVGISGICDQAEGQLSAIHAVLWENGVPEDLGNIGGDAWNTPTAINNQGTIVGFANQFPGIARTFQAFIWTKEGGMKPLGAVSGDTLSLAFGLNDKNQVVGLSVGGPYGIRAFLWNGVMTDLNTVTLPSSPFLLYANDINDRGEIVGEAFDPNTNEAPAYLGTPLPGRSGAATQAVSKGGPQGAIPESVRNQLRQRLGFDPLGD